MDIKIELAGMKLDWPFEPSHVFVPSEIVLDDARQLLWTMRKPRHRPPHCSVLDKFRLLSDKADQAVLKFAAEFGVAFFCEHELPGSHSQVPFAHQFGMKGCWPKTKDGTWFIESVDDYRRYSKGASALVDAAAMVNVDQVPPDEVFWSFVYNRGTPSTWPTASENLPKKSLLERSRRSICDEVNIWVSVSQAHPKIEWDSGQQSWRRAMRHSSWGILGAVALALITTIPMSMGWLLCDACGCSYTASRPPVEGRRKFCDECRGGPKQWALIKRQQREKECNDNEKLRKDKRLPMHTALQKRL